MSQKNKQGMVAAIPAIVIPALTNIKNAKNLDESLLITAIEASWIGERYISLLSIQTMKFAN